ncbi:MAG TPA: ATP-binding cassette domain-containing protein, partial [Bryobacteraceae bacterium]|nr:ATP-binding cassette domain-containing protein [Bryobacteraceae bacterium]
MAEQSKESQLRFEDVTVGFEDLIVLNQVSFDVRQGETRIILGAAGSGKTILLKTAMGLIEPQNGRVFLFGEDISGAAEARLF